MTEPEALHRDLVEWGILEPEPPVRFTKRFQGALARSAAGLQAASEAGAGPTGDPVRHQVESALASFLSKEGKRIGPGHVAFVHAVHLAGLPEAVRRLLGR